MTSAQANADHVVMMTTVASEDCAERIASALIAERLAACVQRFAVNSTYVWKSAVQAEPEVLLLIKTRADRQAAVEARILALHEYEVPEVISTPITSGNAAYLKWIDDSL
jgi:periplasmic divalent cation tolerance protein